MRWRLAGAAIAALLLVVVGGACSSGGALTVVGSGRPMQAYQKVYSADVAMTAEQVSQLWTDYGIGGAAPDGDGPLVFVTAGESTGCPTRVAKVRRDGDIVELTIRAASGGCPSDLVPVSFAVNPGPGDVSAVSVSIEGPLPPPTTIVVAG